MEQDKETQLAAWCSRQDSAPLAPPAKPPSPSKEQLIVIQHLLNAEDVKSMVSFDAHNTALRKVFFLSLFLRIRKLVFREAEKLARCHTARSGRDGILSLTA